MKKLLWIPLLVGVAAFPHSAMANDDIKVENALIRPASPPDSDAYGKVRVEIDPDKNRHRLKVEAEKIDSSLPFQVWLADGSGVLQNVGTMSVNTAIEVEIEFDSKEGPALPYGTTDVTTLAGRALEVRANGLTYLLGTVPSTSGGSGGGGSGGGGSGSGGGSGGGGTDIKVKSFLVRAAASPDFDVKGYVELRDRGTSDQKFKVEAEHIDPSISFSVWVESSLGSGMMVQAGPMGPEDFDAVELELETEDGDPLPNGASLVSSLSGLRVEVRDATNAIYLEGTVPSISGSSSSNSKAKDSYSGSGAELKIRLESEKKGNQSFELEVKKLSIASSVQLFVFDPNSSTLVNAASLTLNKGKAKLKLETKKGQPLPTGATKVADLGGRAFELRDGATSTVLISGNLPQP